MSDIWVIDRERLRKADSSLADLLDRQLEERPESVRREYPNSMAMGPREFTSMGIPPEVIISRYDRSEKKEYVQYMGDGRYVLVFGEGN